MILLDTQVLIWSSFDDRRLGKGARQRMIEAIGADELRMSPISAWETAMLVDKGRVRLALSVQEWITRAAFAHRVNWVELSPMTAASAGQLPGKLHGDPADRLIIATARALGCPLLTSDTKILDYAKAGHVQVIDARH